MIYVYFEHPTNWHCDLVAIFDSEETYKICLPALEAEAKKSGLIVTESVKEESLEHIA